jgi:two-component system LytT family response regulator
LKLKPLNKPGNDILSALIIDDERLARKELISMLQEFDAIEISGEADSVASAIKQLNMFKPDLIFLDIQMPGKSGFDLLDEIETDAKIIFVTAYDEYAIRAFEVNAIDYLPKPVSRERLAKTIDRVIHQTPNNDINNRKLKHNDRLFVEFGTQTRFLKISEIICILAEGDYTTVFLSDGKKGLVTKAMKEWESRLPDDIFCRIHRSSIVNMEYIDKIDTYFNNSYKISLKNLKEPLIISRRYAKKIKGLFS